ncbi:MAG: 4Fe-4S dicluster domain-containing protein [bacterium]|nr:4Fe-4S dicluster domain-containing protein [bacterium]
MGHQTNPDREYRLLQQRLDRNVTGAPASPTFTKILELLFTPEEARMAHQMPTRPTPVSVLAKKLEMDAEELDGKLTEMAAKGVVLDFERAGKRYITLPPVVIGFFEFAFMRTRDDLPMAELARLFEEYMFEDDQFPRSVFDSSTSIARSMVREEALPEGDHTEILDWERASKVVQTADAIGLAQCACRHKASHLGTNCDAPMEVCLCFGMAARSLAKQGIVKRIDKDEGMRILEVSKEAGLMQTGDNVQRHMSYLCNCCGCCCGMVNAIRTFDVRTAIVSSNWLVSIDQSQCTGCGRCVKACAVNALNLDENGDGESRATADGELCLGCGVCAPACPHGAVTMKSRDQRVITPRTFYDRMLAMAIERGKLADLMFEMPEKLSHRALKRIMSAVEKSPPYKAAMAVKPLKSAFLNALVKAAGR